jgi:hypothetical protein
MSEDVIEVVEDTHNKEKDTGHWTAAEKESCRIRYGCEIVVENGSYSDVCTKNAPLDAHIISYIVNDKMCYDLTRGARVLLFNMYWDKFRDNLKSIQWGYGKINPKLWGYKAPERKKRK